jgi:hypothetical protein
MTTLTTAPLDYRRIAEAFVHPLKLRILALMTEPPPPRPVGDGAPEPGWSPNRLYVAAGEALGNVSYHVRELEGRSDRARRRQAATGGARALLHARVIDQRGRRMRRSRASRSPRAVSLRRPSSSCADRARRTPRRKSRRRRVQRVGLLKRREASCCCEHRGRDGAAVMRACPTPQQSHDARASTGRIDCLVRAPVNAQPVVSRRSPSPRIGERTHWLLTERGRERSADADDCVSSRSECVIAPTDTLVIMEGEAERPPATPASRIPSRRCGGRPKRLEEVLGAFDVWSVAAVLDRVASVRRQSRAPASAVPRLRRVGADPRDAVVGFERVRGRDPEAVWRLGDDGVGPRLDRLAPPGGFASQVRRSGYSLKGTTSCSHTVPAGGVWRSTR